MAPVPPAPEAKAPMLQQKCASCHDISVAVMKGKSITLFTGGAPMQWTPETIGKVIREVSSGHMPRGSKLSQEEFTAVVQEVFALASK